MTCWGRVDHVNTVQTRAVAMPTESEPGEKLKILSFFLDLLTKVNYFVTVQLKIKKIYGF